VEVYQMFVAVGDAGGHSSPPRHAFGIANGD
jgi:hypothetical protein